MVISQEQVIAFSLVFARLIMMVGAAPVFSNKEVFGLAKIMLMFWISSLLLFYIPLPISFPVTTIGYVIAILLEMVIGMLLGYVVHLMVYGIQLAGSFMDTQAGLSVATILDPSSGTTATLIQRLMGQMVMLVFLLVNGHHVILGTLIQSFSAVPIGMPFNLGNSARFVAESTIFVFQLGLQISAPILLIVFLVDFGFGMLSRVAPQVNVFQLGFQLKPIVSLFILLAVMPVMVDIMNFIIERAAEMTLETLFYMRL